jgi:riboflavin kinase
MVESIIVKGTVFSGKGKGAEFVNLPWVKKQIIESFGFLPYPGTLNIKLGKDKIVYTNLLKRIKGISIIPSNGFSSGKCFKAYLKDFLECIIVVPEIADYPEDIIEIIASTKIRERFQLKDGDLVEVKIELS